MEVHDDDVISVLTTDGVTEVNMDSFVNISTLNLEDVKSKMGNGSWAARIIYNKRFQGFLIRQFPGEGNRKHYHPDAVESWVILEGEWEWYIEGEGVRKVSVHDIVIMKEGIKHQIKVVGDKPGVRLAISMPDVDHVFEKEA